MLEPETLVVVGAIIRRGDRVFAARRNADRSAGGLWEFPGGKVEKNESPQEALRRELTEELGIEVLVGDLASRHTTPLGGKMIDLACYWAELTTESPSSSTDHDQIEWIRIDDLRGRDWSPADVPIIDDITN